METQKPTLDELVANGHCIIIAANYIPPLSSFLNDPVVRRKLIPINFDRRPAPNTSR
jgi:hypothetical protein